MAASGAAERDVLASGYGGDGEESHACLYIQYLSGEELGPFAELHERCVCAGEGLLYAEWERCVGKGVSAGVSACCSVVTALFSLLFAAWNFVGEAVVLLQGVKVDGGLCVLLGETGSVQMG